MCYTNGEYFVVKGRVIVFFMFVNFSEAEKFLYDLRNAGSKFSLSRMEKLCAYFGNPQKKFSTIHVAGTNGKGSVCAMLEVVLRRACGFKTGLFTSPHLTYLGERIQVGRVAILREKLLSLLLEVRAACCEIFGEPNAEDYPSFFEYMTIIAFLEFSREGVDVALIETGLGGRLDSTNVVSPTLSIITSIALDHTEFLGSTLEEIAAEKAGIIKEKTPVVAGFIPESAMEIIENFSAKKCAPLFKVSDFVKECGLPETSLVGSFQRRNAAAVLLALRVISNASGGKIFGKEFSEDKAKAALLNVDWPARWQEIKLQSSGRLFLDSSHNVEGAEALEENLNALVFSLKSKPAICVGVLGEERAKPILKLISQYASKIILFVPNQPRSLSFEKMEEFIPENFPRDKIFRRKVSDVFSHPFRCFENLNDSAGVIVSTGSIYLAGEVLASLKGEEADGLSDKI